MMRRLGAALGCELRIRNMPRPVFRLAAVFAPILRELDEMRYQWAGPLVVDDRRFRERFGTRPTTLDDGARATVEWAKRNYAAGRRWSER